MDDDLSPRKPRNDTEVFKEQCPFYLSIGMSSAEYWHGDPILTRYFREAFKMKQKRENELAWLHGLYVYDATISALTHLSKDKNSHKNYAEKPYSLSKEEIQEDNEAEVLEAQARAEVWMKNWASATQKMFKDKN